MGFPKIFGLLFFSLNCEDFEACAGRSWIGTYSLEVRRETSRCQPEILKFQNQRHKRTNTLGVQTKPLTMLKYRIINSNELSWCHQSAEIFFILYIKLDPLSHIWFVWSNRKLEKDGRMNYSGNRLPIGKKLKRNPCPTVILKEKMDSTSMKKNGVQSENMEAQ